MSYFSLFMIMTYWNIILRIQGLEMCFSSACLNIHGVAVLIMIAKEQFFKCVDSCHKFCGNPPMHVIRLI